MTIEPARHVLFELANELEALLTEQLTPEAFRAKYRSEVVTNAVRGLIASVEHFLSDADIRARDAGYRRMQEHEMRRLIDCLRGGRLEAAERISFLRATEGEE